MKTNRMYSAAIFDLDGLILDTEGISLAAWKKALADFGFEFDERLYRKIVGLKTQDIEQLFYSFYGLHFPLQKVSQRRLEYIYEYIDEHGIKVKPGLVELLAFLDKIKLLKAVATSSSRAAAIRKLTVSNLAGRFDAVVCGDEIDNGKPAPDIFLEAARQLQTAPKRCLVFEDSENGIRAGRTAGMTVIMIPDFTPPSDEAVRLAHRVFPSLYEVIPFLQEFVNEPA